MAIKSDFEIITQPFDLTLCVSSTDVAQSQDGVKIF